MASSSDILNAWRANDSKQELSEIMYPAGTSARFFEPLWLAQKGAVFAGNLKLNVQDPSDPLTNDLAKDVYKFTSKKWGKCTRLNFSHRDNPKAPITLPPMAGIQLALGPEGNWDPDGTSGLKMTEKKRYESVYSLMLTPFAFDPSLKDPTHPYGYSKYFLQAMKCSEDLAAWAASTILHDTTIPSDIRDRALKDRNVKGRDVSDDEILADLLEKSTSLISCTKNRDETVRADGHYIGLQKKVWYEESTNETEDDAGNKRKTTNGPSAAQQQKRRKFDAADGDERKQPTDNGGEPVVEKSEYNHAELPIYKMVTEMRGTRPIWREQRMTDKEVKDKVKNGHVFIPRIRMHLATNITDNKTKVTKPFSWVTSLDSLVWLGPGASKPSGGQDRGPAYGEVNDEYMQILLERAKAESMLIQDGDLVGPEELEKLVRGNHMSGH